MKQNDTPQPADDPEANNAAGAGCMARLVRGGSEMSLDALAVRAITAVASASRASDKYNDYGSAMAIRDELEEIENDLRASLYSASRRARRLARRTELWEAGKREVPLLHSSANAKRIRATD